VDAPFFRTLAAALCPRLAGGRLGKIFEPAPGCLVFAHKTGRESAFLLFRPAKSGNILCLSPAKPPMPHDPGSRAMWLRKRVGDARVLGCVADWPTLRLGLLLDGRVLILDLREGPRVQESLPDGFGREPPWPPLERILHDDEVWRGFPHLSPSLRRRLRSLPENEARLLLERLAGGGHDGVWLPAGEDGPGEPALWPPAGDDAGAERVADPLLAARRAYEPRFYALLAGEAKAAAEAEKNARKRQKRLESLLDRDEERLRGLVAHAREAEALQAGVHLFADGPLPGTADLVHPDGGRVRVALDTRLSAAQNMQRLFALAAKGRRGLAHVAARRAAVAAEAARTAAAPPPGPEEGRPAQAAPGARPLPKRWAGLPVKVFRTSDGFWAARGKSAKGNHALLTEGGSPHDYWLHVQDAPGAHVILRRDHPGQEVPERSLLEAAALAALSSPLKESAWADVLLAEVRHVRAIKGAAAGLVRLERPLRVLRVRPDPGLETGLLPS